MHLNKQQSCHHVTQRRKNSLKSDQVLVQHQAMYRRSVHITWTKHQWIRYFCKHYTCKDWPSEVFYMHGEWSPTSQPFCNSTVHYYPTLAWRMKMQLRFTQSLHQYTELVYRDVETVATTVAIRMADTHFVSASIKSPYNYIPALTWVNIELERLSLHSNVSQPATFVTIVLSQIKS